MRAKDITTGISAADRATTIHVAIDPKSKPGDLARPGHIFPLKAQTGRRVESARGRPKGRSIWRGWPGFIPPA